MHYPNVTFAQGSDERDSLEKRYQTAMEDAAARGCQAIVLAFEEALAQSQAVMGTKLEKLMPVVRGDRDVVATFHEVSRLRFSRTVPIGPDWDVVRPIAETILLGSVKLIDRLHYAALSLDGRSLPNYGDVTIQFREHTIAHRASLFDDNSGVYVYRNGINFPKGSRVAWPGRAKLCVAKLAAKIDAATHTEDFPNILLKSGATALDDELVEVHIFGSMTFATFQRVVVTKRGAKPSSLKRPRKRRGTTDERALRDYCKLYDTKCEMV